MIRLSLVLGSFLLGGLSVPPLAIGQDSSKDAPLPKEAAGQLEEVVIELEELVGQMRDEAVAQSKASQTAKGQPGPQTYSRKQTFTTSKAGDSVSSAVRVYDALEANFGLHLSNLDDTLRSQLEIPDGQGVLVFSVKSASLADNAGLKKNDILLSIGDQKAIDTSQVKKILLDLTKEAILVRLIRDGKPTQMSVVGPEHGFPSEEVEYWIGVPVSPVDGLLRAHLPMLPGDAGLIVNEVVKGSPADAVSIRKNDILIRMDGKPLKTSESLIQQIQATQGKPVPLEILRAGKPMTVTLTPMKRTRQGTFNLSNNVNNPLTYTYRVVRPSMAIELDAKSLQQPLSMQAGPDGKVDVKHLLSGRILRAEPASQNNPAMPAPKAAAEFQLRLDDKDDRAIARIETQMKEFLSKLDGITKALESLKKSSEK